MTDDAAGAFRTIQKGIDVACNDLDAASFTCTIQVRAGTYTEAVTLRSYLGTGTFILRGDTATPANVAIAPTSGTALTSRTTSTWLVEGFKLTSANGHGLSTSGLVMFQSLEFGACSLYQIDLVVGGQVIAVGNYRISGGALTHVTATASGALAILDGRTVTITTRRTSPPCSPGRHAARRSPLQA